MNSDVFQLNSDDLCAYSQPDKNYHHQPPIVSRSGGTIRDNLELHYLQAEGPTHLEKSPEWHR